VVDKFGNDIEQDWYPTKISHLVKNELDQWCPNRSIENIGLWVPRKWGGEILHKLRVEPEKPSLQYIKTLIILPGTYESSIHYHVKKSEVFVVTHGTVVLQLWDKELNPLNQLWMSSGDTVLIERGQPHSFQAFEELSEVREIATLNEDLPLKDLFLLDSKDNIKLRGNRKL
jgi:quercetin dioxygenase-like cupin family protein